MPILAGDEYMYDMYNLNKHIVIKKPLDGGKWFQVTIRSTSGMEELGVVSRYSLLNGSFIKIGGRSICLT